MVEPTNQMQYQSLTTLQQSVGATYTDAELKIVKMLYDQRRQFGASKQTQLDQASAALANLDLATACGILGCTVPVHGGSGGSSGAAGTSGAAGATGAAGARGTAGASGGAGASGHAGAGGGGAAGASGAGGHAGASGAAGQTSTPGAAGSSSGAAGAAGGTAGGNVKGASGCSVAGASHRDLSLFLVVGAAIALARRRRRA